MGNIRLVIENLDSLTEYIKNIHNWSNPDKKLTKFLKNKVIETYQEVVNEKLIGGTTMDSYIALYKRSWYIEDYIDEYGKGFRLVNYATIPKEQLNTKNKGSYPLGFSVAMAFEYGTGIVGIQTNNEKAWKYNVHNYENGWKFKDENGLEQFTSGFVGFEIFRYTADRVNQRLNSWINEYFRSD